MDSTYNTQGYSNAHLSFPDSSQTWTEKFVLDRKHLLQEPESAEPKIRNVIIPKLTIKKGEEDFCEFLGSLRISVEIYPDSEYIAYLVAERSISGYGSNIDEAVENAVLMLMEDFTFYLSTDDARLTPDAIELKAKLNKLFEMKDGRH